MPMEYTKGMTTQKQSAAIQHLVDNGGKNVGQAMREAGYSEAMIKNPQKLTNSVGYRQYQEQTKTIALKKYDITWDLLIAKLYTKLHATRKDITGDVVENDTIQLAAIKLLITLLDAHQADEPAQPTAASLPEGIDEIQMVRLIKNQ